MMKTFRDFILQRKGWELGLGIVIGVALTPLVMSLVNDVIMPVFGWVIGVDFSNLFIVLREGNLPGPYATLEQAQAAGAIVLNLGRFVNALLTVLLIATILSLSLPFLSRLKSGQDRPK
jgi:large conductance mechanosensitive channel